MAEYIRRDDDDEARRGFSYVLGIVLAILVIAALVWGGWFLFFRGNTGNNTNINIQTPGSGETTSGP